MTFQDLCIWLYVKVGRPARTAKMAWQWAIIGLIGLLAVNVAIMAIISWRTGDWSWVGQIKADLANK